VKWMLSEVQRSLLRASHRSISGTTMLSGRATGKEPRTRCRACRPDADGRDDCLASVEGLWPIDSVRVHFVHDASVWERPE
jgi:hypothetical protein